MDAIVFVVVVGVVVVVVGAVVVGVVGWQYTGIAVKQEQVLSVAAIRTTISLNVQ